MKGVNFAICPFKSCVSTCRSNYVLLHCENASVGNLAAYFMMIQLLAVFRHDILVVLCVSIPCSKIFDLAHKTPAPMLKLTHASS